MRKRFVTLGVLLNLLLGATAAPQQQNQAFANLGVNTTAGTGLVGPVDVNVCSGTFSLINLRSAAMSSQNVPMVFAVNADVAPGSLVTPGGQIVDIQLPGVQVFSSLLPGVFNQIFQMAPDGTGAVWQMFYYSDNAPPTYAIQTAVVDPAVAPAPDSFTLSAAFRVSLSPIQTLTLADDAFVEVPLGWSFAFYDTLYASVFVGSNGRITFGAGSLDFSESQSEFRSGPPCIAPFWDDLNPAVGGSVTLCTTPASYRCVVKYESVPEYLNTGSNSATVVLESTVISLVYGMCSLLDGISGISPGNNIDPNAGSGIVDLSGCVITACPATLTPNRSLFEIFTTLSPFDLSGYQLVFLPTSFTPANAYIVF